MHTLLGLGGTFPSIIQISGGKLQDVNALDLLIPEPAAICVMSSGYLCFERLFVLHQTGAFFVTRVRSNTAMRLVYSP